MTTVLDNSNEASTSGTKDDEIPEGYIEVMPAPEKLDDGTTSPRLTS